MTQPIHLSKADVTSLEEEYVLRSLRSGWVAPAGPDLSAFENEVADRVGVSQAVGLSSGTAALHLALIAWGIGPGDIVPVSTLTFAATVNAIRYVGATPYLIDCEEESGNISLPLLAIALKNLRNRGRRVPAIITVDLFGKAVDYATVTEIANEYEVRVLCDAAESFGSTHRGQQVGSFGDASIISFNGNKIMTTSGGGMLLTNNAAMAAHARKLSTQAREPVEHYEHTEVGYNYRLSNVLAALGRAQLSRLDEMIERRRGWRRRYHTLFAEHPGIRILGGAADDEDNCWLTAIIIDADSCSLTPQALANALRTYHIETRPVWKPMHLQPVFSHLEGAVDGTSERLFARGLTLPSGSAMTEAQFRVVEVAVSEALS